MQFNQSDFLGLNDQLNEEQRLIRDNLRRFVDDKVIPVIGEHFEAGTFPGTSSNPLRTWACLALISKGMGAQVSMH